MIHWTLCWMYLVRVFSNGLIYIDRIREMAAVEN